MVPGKDAIDAWASIYANSASVRAAVSFGHVGALLLGGGCAVAADLSILRAARRGVAAVHDEVVRLHGAHRIVITSLLVMIGSGVLLMASDLDAHVESTAFWIKMACVAALVANGALLVRASDRVDRSDTRAAQVMRAVSMTSLALWFATTLMGAVLPNAL